MKKTRFSIRSILTILLLAFVMIFFFSCEEQIDTGKTDTDISQVVESSESERNTETANSQEAEPEKTEPEETEPEETEPEKTEPEKTEPEETEPEEIEPEEDTPSQPPVSRSSSINGVPLSEWRIGVNGKNSTALVLADELVSYFESSTGERIQIVNANTVPKDIKNIILLGATGRNVKAPTYFEGHYYVAKTDSIGCMVTMLSTKTNGLRTLMDTFKNDLIKQTGETEIAFTIPERDCVHFDFEDVTYTRENNPSGDRCQKVYAGWLKVPQWTLQSEQKETLYEGVAYIEQYFLDEHNRPYRTYALILDPEKVNFYVGTAKDGTAFTQPTADRQTTQGHMQAAIANGTSENGKDKIFAGINANFFNMSEYSPLGFVVKDGTRIQSVANGARPFFAVTSTGEIIMDEAVNYRTATNGKTVTQAVAGNNFILKDGLLTEGACENGSGSDEGQGKHPRTLIGLTSDGHIILGVLDGRRMNHSYGAGYASAALWMRSLGATDVINLDGGGSSNMVLRDLTNNTYKTCNKPSDGDLRKVYNSLLVGLK